MVSLITKLKNLRLTSVDLVRRGANQAADICLAKSADQPEDLPAMDSETALAYTGALAKSIQSIQEDDTLDNDAKVEMIQKSFEQFSEAVAKYNPYHEPAEAASEPESPQEEPVVEKSVPMLDVIEEIETKKA